MELYNSSLSNVGNKVFRIERNSQNKSPDGNFSDLLKDALTETNRLQNEAKEMDMKLVAGEIEDTHQVVLAAEKAEIALQMTMQVRNKIMEAYQELMRMQV